MNRIITVAVFFVVQCTFALPLTPLVGNSFRVTESAVFDVDAGAGTYLVDMSSQGGSTQEADPTLILTAGQTYDFVRTDIGHDIVIMNADIPTAENPDGTLYRTVTDSTLNDFALSENIIGNSSASVRWTPTDAGVYYYTCYFPSHQQMFGKLIVVPARSNQGAYRIASGAAIQVANSGASNYLLNMSNYGGSNAEPDPT